MGSPGLRCGPLRPCCWPRAHPVRVPEAGANLMNPDSLKNPSRIAPPVDSLTRRALVTPIPMLLLTFFMVLADSTRTYPVSVARAESLWVTDAGEGRPVVLIPGIFGSAYSYRRVLPLLTERGYHAIVIEPLGIGRSAKPQRADYSLDAQADRVEAVLQQLGVTGAILVAHSANASMAYRLAYRRPDLVSGVVSIEGGPAERATTPGFRRAMVFVPWIKWFGGINRVRKQIRKGLIKASGDTTWVTDEAVDGYTAAARADLDGTLMAFLGMAASKEREKLAPHLREIHCPV